MLRPVKFALALLAVFAFVGLGSEPAKATVLPGTANLLPGTCDDHNSGWHSVGGAIDIQSLSADDLFHCFDYMELALRAQAWWHCQTSSAVIVQSVTDIYYDDNVIFDDQLVWEAYSVRTVCPIMASNAVLQPDEWVDSRDGNFRLLYQLDGNLVVYDMRSSPWTSVWHTGTHDNNPGHVHMQLDGNLVVYNGDDEPVWASDTSSSGASVGIDNGTIVMSDSGGLPIWCSGGCS